MNSGCPQRAGLTPSLRALLAQRPPWSQIKLIHILKLFRERERAIAPNIVIKNTSETTDMVRIRYATAFFLFYCIRQFNSTIFRPQKQPFESSSTITKPEKETNPSILRFARRRWWIISSHTKVLDSGPSNHYTCHENKSLKTAKNDTSRSD